VSLSPKVIVFSPKFFSVFFHKFFQGNIGMAFCGDFDGSDISIFISARVAIWNCGFIFTRLG